MKDVVDLEISAPLTRVAELYADPENNPKWMRDTEYQPLTGKPGAAGSTFKLVSHEAKMTFIVTVVKSDAPHEFRLRLDASTVTVLIDVNLTASSAEKTRFVSAEDFQFKGFARLFAFLARGSISKAHRRQIESFKQFVEHLNGSHRVNGDHS